MHNDTHITYLLENTFFVFMLFVLFFFIFLYCFRTQIEDLWPDAIFYAILFTLSLFFFWLLHHDIGMLVLVIIMMVISMVIWMIKF